MTKLSEFETLSVRDREILRSVVDTYITTGEPVSSRTVTRHSDHGLSAATIRNVMSDLEDRGLLSQPHSSSGRVPTAAGYHFFIDSLMPSRIVSPSAQRYIRGQIVEALTDVEALMGVVTHLLTELSHQIGLVVRPVIGETTLQAIHFVKLSGARVLCVLESVSGLVEHRTVETRKPFDREELVRISNYLNDRFSGLSLREIRDRLLLQMAQERAELDELLANAVTLAQQALGADGTPELLVEGTEIVLSQPELSDVRRVRRLLGTFTDKAKLVSILDQVIQTPGMQVIIGEESDLTSGLNFSLVATSYGGASKPLGTLGIFGPSRMEYDRVVPLVDYLGRLVTEALEHREGDTSTRLGEE